MIMIVVGVLQWDIIVNQNNMKRLKQSLKIAKKHLKRVAKELPDNDAYAYLYSLLADIAEAIDIGAKQFGMACKEAKIECKNNPHQPLNRAKKWCRKP